MCQRVTCSKCGKPGYAGCGRHVEAVLADVPAEARCRCREEKIAPKGAQAKRGLGLLSFFRRSSGSER